jgi:hypothetical protein
MAYIKYNPNPYNTRVGDCVVRALTLALDIDWDMAYVQLVIQGLKMADMPSANNVWGTLLQQEGFTRHIIPNTCPNCYSVADFSKDHQKGTFVLATGSHVLTVIDGNYYDSWDSGNEVPIYYFTKEINHA